MSTTTTTKQGFFTRMGQVLAELRHQRARNAAYRALASLDDRTLEDIGIARHDIWSAIDAALGMHAGERPVAGARSAQQLPTPATQAAGMAANDTDTTAAKRPLAA